MGGRRRTVYVCTGSHCRKQRAKDGRLDEIVGQLPVDVTRVRCQKVCRGPVLGIEVANEIEWFERVRGKKALRALVHLLEEGKLREPLEKRRRSDRTGKRRS